MNKSEAYNWQLAWFFSMSKEEQFKLIKPFGYEGFVKESDSNIGASHIFGLSVSLNCIKGATEESEELLGKLREKLNLLTWKYRKADEWGFDKISGTEEWEEIRCIAKTALEKDGYRVAPPRKPLDITEYPEHFQMIV